MDKTADASGIWRETSDASGRGEGHPPMTQSLKERLLKVESSSADFDPLRRLVATNRNPDGPEAVREIERLEGYEALAHRSETAWHEACARAERAEARVAELEAGLRILADESSPHDQTGQPLQVRVAKDLTRRIEFAAALLKSQEQPK